MTAHKMAQNSLSARRFAHCLRVADMAEDLAKAYGVDREKAVVASLLHDLVKEWPLDKLMAAGKAYGVDPTFRDHPALLHAPVAARLLQDKGLVTDPHILEAIALHTIGGPGMGDLALIVYISDYLEAGRPYRREKEIAAARKKGLYALALYVCAQKLSFIIRKEAFVHPDSFHLYYDLWTREREGRP